MYDPANRNRWAPGPASRLLGEAILIEGQSEGDLADARPAPMDRVAFDKTSPIENAVREKIPRVADKPE